MKVIHPEKVKYHQDLLVSVVDSMPIIMTKGLRSFGAKVATQYEYP